MEQSLINDLLVMFKPETALLLMALMWCLREIRRLYCDHIRIRDAVIAKLKDDKKEP